MHRVLVAVLASWALWTSTARAADNSSPAAMKAHPGFLAFQAAEQKLLDAAAVEKSLPENMNPDLRKKQMSDKTTELQNQAYDQCKISIAAYGMAAGESIDLSALYFCLVNAIEYCETPSAKPNCEAPIQSVLQTTQKQLAGKPGTTGLSNLIGGHHARQKRYREAMTAYYQAYSQLSKASCSRDHVNQLLTILNLHLESGDQNGFNQYWKVTDYCQSSGLMQPKGTVFVRDTALNRVVLQEPAQERSDAASSVAKVSAPPSPAIAATAPVVPRELPPKAAPVIAARTPTAEPETESEAEETDSDENNPTKPPSVAAVTSAGADTTATSKAITKSDASATTAPPKATTKPDASATTEAETTSPKPASAAATTTTSTPNSTANQASASTPASSSTSTSTSASTPAPTSTPTPAPTLAPTPNSAQASVPAKRDVAVMKPMVADEVFGSVQEFIPALLRSLAKNTPEWEASLAKRRAKKDKDENEIRELEEIAKAKKENEKKAMDQMLTKDPDARAKQLKNVLDIHLGDSIEKVKAALGKPNSELSNDRKLAYEQLNTGATVGDLIAGKLPPFVSLVFTFNANGLLQEITYSDPQGHGNIVCR